MCSASCRRHGRHRAGPCFGCGVESPQVAFEVASSVDQQHLPRFIPGSNVLGPRCGADKAGVRQVRHTTPLSSSHAPAAEQQPGHGHAMTCGRLRAQRLYTRMLPVLTSKYFRDFGDWKILEGSAHRHAGCLNAMLEQPTELRLRTGKLTTNPWDEVVSLSQISTSQWLQQ